MKHTDFNIDKDIINRNKFQKEKAKEYKEKFTEEFRNSKEEQKLEDLYYGFLLIEKCYFEEMLNQIDEEIKEDCLKSYFYKIEHRSLMMIRNYKAISLLGALKMRYDYKNDVEKVKLRPKKWKELIENNEDSYTQIHSDTKEYKKLFEDDKTKFIVKIATKISSTEVVDGKLKEIEKVEERIVSVPISSLEYDFKVFRINNMKLFTSFNSILHFYNCQGRKDLYKLETVYYRYNLCYAVEKIINNTSKFRQIELVSH